MPRGRLADDGTAGAYVAAADEKVQRLQKQAAAKGRVDIRDVKHRLWRKLRKARAYGAWYRRVQPPGACRRSRAEGGRPRRPARKNQALAAPRDSASIPIWPLPANMSRNRPPGTEKLDDIERGLLDAVQRGPHPVAGRRREPQAA